RPQQAAVQVVIQVGRVDRVLLHRGALVEAAELVAAGQLVLDLESHIRGHHHVGAALGLGVGHPGLLLWCTRRPGAGPGTILARARLRRQRPVLVILTAAAGSCTTGTVLRRPWRSQASMSSRRMDLICTDRSLTAYPGAWSCSSAIPPSALLSST